MFAANNCLLFRCRQQSFSFGADVNFYCTHRYCWETSNAEEWNEILRMHLYALGLFDAVEVWVQPKLKFLGFFDSDNVATLASVQFKFLLLSCLVLLRSWKKSVLSTFDGCLNLLRFHSVYSRRSLSHCCLVDPLVICYLCRKNGGWEESVVVAVAAAARVGAGWQRRSGGNSSRSWTMTLQQL